MYLMPNECKIMYEVFNKQITMCVANTAGAIIKIYVQ